MSNTSTNALARHTAAAPLAGYIYQIQRAVLRLFDLQEGEALGLEVLDDLHVEQNAVATELAQVKHHLSGRPPNLTDASPELWKTLGTWAAAIVDGSLDLSTVQKLVLITNATISPDSLAEMLAKGEDVDLIIHRLLTVSQSSNKNISEAMSLLHTMTSDTLRSFIERLVLYAGEPGLSATTEQVQQKLRKFGFHAQSLNDAAQKFSGWVWDKIVAKLGTLPGVLISESEFHSALCHIRDEFTGTNLPARYNELKLDDSELAGQTSKIYVRQIELVGASQSAKLRSILAYFRAAHERNTWLYQGEILPDRLRQYDQELIERWESEFETMRCKILNWADQEELRQKGLVHLQEIERIEVPIQTGWIYRYLTCGSYHALADELKVGWHPEFRSQILSGQPLTAKGNTP